MHKLCLCAHVLSLHCCPFNKQTTIFHGLHSRLSLNGHLNKTDTSVKRTPRVGPSLSLLPLFDSLKDLQGGWALPHKSEGDAHQKIQIKPLGETNVGVAQA